MKLFILLPATILITAGIHFHLKNRQGSNEDLRKNTFQKRKNIIPCNPDRLWINLDANPIPLLSGWGNYRMAVTVKNDSADIFFQQGINLYYGFHIIEALASFDKATKFDKEFAMAWWGKALSYGPNINDLGYTASPEALEAVKNAALYANKCTLLEKALIDAMKTRYTEDTTISRERLNQQYADAMQQVYTTFPNSADAAALFADALMVEHPWDLYDKYYRAKPWTPKLVRVLEKLVQRFPFHPGGGHYYIHAIEGSTQPGKALAVADRLGKMMPGVAHVVHMPSHIYIRSGHYSKGVEVNKSAVDGYYNYLLRYAPVSGNTFIYLLHNQHMQAACAMMDGQYANSLKYAKDLSKNVDSAFLDAGGYFGVMGQYLDMTSTFVSVRFGRWDEILSEPEVVPQRMFSSIMQHFARGIAYCKKQQPALAEKHLLALQNEKNNTQLLESPAAFNAGIAAVNVAEKILQGAIAEVTNKLPEAIDFYKTATEMEDGMLYNEPRDWQLPARHYLGHVLLQHKAYGEAEKVYKKDLEINPNNPWSLAGLLQALEKQGKPTANIRLQLSKATTRSDVQIKNSVW